MAKKTINQALRDLFIGLGGDISALADNTSVSDYIADLESAIKAAASGGASDLIDDTEASSNKTYSSSKIESLIPEDELPDVTSDNNGMVLTVVEGAWNKANLPASGYSETTLYTGELEQYVPATLSDSIANYDALILVTIATDPDTAAHKEVRWPYISTTDLVGNYYSISFGNSDPVFAFKFTSGTALSWMCTTIATKIIGVKFN